LESVLLQVSSHTWGSQKVMPLIFYLCTFIFLWQ